MIEINGAMGEGGGQIFRSSLTLAMVTGRAVRIHDIRAGRQKPGLLRQHLTCLRAAQTISQAKVKGDEIKSSRVEFIPSDVQAGKYHFAIGSAGSVHLVLQTILLPLCFADGESEITIEGGTHNPAAPSAEFMQHCFLPMMKRIGFDIEYSIEEYGFYPAGGGKIHVRINPVNQLKALVLDSRGELQQVVATAISSKVPHHVTERELAVIENKAAFKSLQLNQKIVNSIGPGNIVSLVVQYENITEVFECVGEKSLKAERVAKLALNKAKHYVSARHVVDEYLTDQLLLPMVLARGGQFVTSDLSRHSETNIDVIKLFEIGDVFHQVTDLGLTQINIK